jgi:hypothetical protein
MDEFNDNEIARLLRLKRYEQPPPGYFDNFLHEFHRRQRDELLRQPLWRICLERAHNFMLQLDVRSLASYPTAVAAMLVCAAIFSLKVYQQPETARVASHSPLTLSVPVNADQEWNLASPVSAQMFRTQPLRSFRESAQTHRAAPPRYVLDSVPVSYEPTFRFYAPRGRRGRAGFRFRRQLPFRPGAIRHVDQPPGPRAFRAGRQSSG